MNSDEFLEELHKRFYATVQVVINACEKKLHNDAKVSAYFHERVNKDIFAFVADYIDKLSDNVCEDVSDTDDTNNKDDIPTYDDKITCSLCGGSYSLVNKSHHEATRKHRIEDAKKHGMYDFENNRIKTN